MSIFGATQIITDKGKYAACLRLSAGDGNGKIAKVYGKAASRNGGWLCPDMGGRYGGGPRPVKSIGLADEALIDIARTYNVRHSTNSSCVSRAGRGRAPHTSS